MLCCRCKELYIYILIHNSEELHMDHDKSKKKQEKIWMKVEMNENPSQYQVKTC